MLFWIFILISVAGIVWCKLNKWSTFAFLVCFCAVAAAIISFLIISFNYFGADGFVSSYNKRYEILSYQVENNLYENDNDLGKKELVNQVQEWNENLANNKALQENFWIGIYIPNIYDQFEFIDYTKVK